MKKRIINGEGWMIKIDDLKAELHDDLDSKYEDGEFCYCDSVRNYILDLLTSIEE